MRRRSRRSPARDVDGRYVCSAMACRADRMSPRRRPLFAATSVYHLWSSLGGTSPSALALQEAAIESISVLVACDTSKPARRVSEHWRAEEHLWAWGHDDGRSMRYPCGAHRARSARSAGPRITSVSWQDRSRRQPLPRDHRLVQKHGSRRPRPLIAGGQGLPVLG